MVFVFFLDYRHSGSLCISFPVLSRRLFVDCFSVCVLSSRSSLLVFFISLRYPVRGIIPDFLSGGLE
ncbi:MAG: hypothetical protein PSN37_03900 [Alphaproteobacteria bacterium]|nr:hypothetical protein [Alphaproteobacteria bacterium]